MHNFDFVQLIGRFILFSDMPHVYTVHASNRKHSHVNIVQIFNLDVMRCGDIAVQISAHFPARFVHISNHVSHLFQVDGSKGIMRAKAKTYQHKYGVMHFSNKLSSLFQRIVWSLIMHWPSIYD